MGDSSMFITFIVHNKIFGPTDMFLNRWCLINPDLV